MRSRPPAERGRRSPTGSAISMHGRNVSLFYRTIRARSKNSFGRRAAPHAKELPHEHGGHASPLGSHRGDRRDAAPAERFARRLGWRRLPPRAGDEQGISHFLEHMAFKGTKRRTARQIAEEIE